ncbi:hypothetical protein HYV71_04145 [Candidatus Uhrbacteria bacterium]|nr:hypothetical protein [Candidatus Uhrbacteria bacterium]
MAQSEKKKSSLPLLLGILFIVLALGGGWYAYTTYFRPVNAEDDLFAGQTGSAQFPVKKIDWDRAIFTSPAFRSLTGDYSQEVLLSPTEVGNDSPFLVERR